MNDLKLELLMETKRADQLAINCSWLREQIHIIHMALCPGASPKSWQEEATQAVEAAVKLSKP